jgi:hypothetical protein
MQKHAWRVGQSARSWAWSALVVICLFGCLPISTWAQVTSGSLTGAVSDSSGAVVPGAKVVLTDTNKGYDYPATTDATGRYLITNLLPSTYKIAVQASGFKTSAQTGIVIDVGTRLSVDVRLELGTISQSVKVVGAAPILSTQDAVTGQEVDRTMVNALPLINRNVLDLAFLAPGVLQEPGSVYGTGSSIGFSSNGGRTDASEVLIDGVAATTYEPNGNIYTVLFEPPVEAVQEFKIMQSNFTAEEGFSGNAYINLVMRSGTNAFHGSAWDFLRNQKLDSNNWFSNAAGGTLPALRRNQFGATFGGPIKKDKTFFFVDWESLREHSGTTRHAGFPSAAERQGDFGEVCTRRDNGTATFINGICSDPNGQIWDPYSGIYAMGSPNGYWGRALQTPVTNNNLALFQSAGNPNLVGTGYQLSAVPGNLMDPVAQKMFQYYPMPNLNLGTSAYNPYNNWSGSGVAVGNNDGFDVRIDQRFTDMTAFNARVSLGRGVGEGWNCFGNALSPCGEGPINSSTRSVALGLNHTISPRTILNVTAGFTRFYSYTEGSAKAYPNFNPVTSLGLPSYVLTDGTIASPAVYIYGGYAAPTGGVQSIGASTWSVYRNGSNVYHLLSTVTHMRGHHELKFGGEWRENQMNWFQDATPGGLEEFSYNNTSQFLYNPGVAGIGGDALASFMTGVGNPWEWGQYEVSPHFSTQNYRWAGFTQDNWRATKKLTVNLGLRYDLEIPRTERYNRESYLDLTQPLSIHPGAIDAASWPSILPMPDVSDPRGGLVYLSNKQRHPVDTNYKDFGPRLGLAYRLRNNLVIRTGYGVYYNPSQFGTQGAGSTGNEGFSATTSWLTTMNGDGVTPWGRISDPFPASSGGLLLPTGSSLGNLTNLGLSINEPLRDQNISPYSQNWSFGFQYQLPGNWLIDANYVGTKGTHLYDLATGGLQYFGPWIQQEATNPALVAALSTYVPNPYSGVINAPGCGICGPTIPAGDLMLPYPQFSTVSEDPTSVANSIYNAFQLTVEKRLSNEFSLLATYTNSKSIDSASTGGWAGQGFAMHKDPNNLKLERSVSEWDIPQVLQISYVYQLPFGKGKKFGGSWNPVVDGFLGGWQTNGIWRFDNGQPMSIGLSGGIAALTYGGGVNQTGVLKVNPKSKWFTDGYFANANDVLSIPPDYTIGTAPREEPDVRVPGTKNATLSVFKEFSLNKLREGSKLEFRVESFNALNHPQFGGIVTTWNTATFGDVQSQANVPRQVQMALKIYF